MLRLVLYLVLLMLFLMMLEDILFYETDWTRMGKLSYIKDLLARFLPDMNYMPQVIKPLLDTFLIALLGTGLALVLSLPVAYLGAKNITPFYPFTYSLGRLFMTLSRSVHEIIWGLIFVSALGLGALPGILALGCRSVGFMAKTTGEALENVKRDPIEAVESTGAGTFQVIIFGIVPQVLPIFLGNAIFQLDMNFRRAAILGLVGAGGIGLLFAEHMMILEYHKAATVVLAIAVMVVCGEVISNRIRSRVI